MIPRAGCGGAFLPDGSLALLVKEDGSTRMLRWSPVDGRFNLDQPSIRDLGIPWQNWDSLRMCADEQRLWFAQSRGSGAILDRAAKKVLLVAENLCAVSPDGKRIAYQGPDAMIHLRETGSQREVPQLRCLPWCQQWCIGDVWFSPDWTKVVFGVQPKGPKAFCVFVWSISGKVPDEKEVPAAGAAGRDLETG